LFIYIYIIFDRFYLPVAVKPPAASYISVNRGKSKL